MHAQRTKGRSMTINITPWKIDLEARIGILFSFVKSLTASAKGVKRPIIEGLFGPLRSCT